VADELGYAGFGVYDNGACAVSNSFSSSDLLMQTGVSTENTSDCGGGRGTNTSVNVYYFPQIKTGEVTQESGLSDGAIVAIVVIPLLVLFCTIGGAMAYRRYRKDGDCRFLSCMRQRTPGAPKKESCWATIRTCACCPGRPIASRQGSHQIKDREVQGVE